MGRLLFLVACLLLLPGNYLAMRSRVPTSGSSPVCGNSITETGEDCDDGNATQTDACIDCVAAACGDGNVWSGTEECDDGGTVAGDGCSELCTTETGTLVAAITATKIQGSTCVAPCAVHFDALATESTVTTREMHVLYYEWCYDWDGAACNDGAVAWEFSGWPVDRDINPIGGHVYRTPGTYTARLYVEDGHGNTDTETVSVVVADRATQFASTAYCFSNDADFTGAPARCTGRQVTTTDWDVALNTHCNVDEGGAKNECLFKRGDAFVHDSANRVQLNDGAGIGYIGDFGSDPQQPQIFSNNANGPLEFFGSDRDDAEGWTVDDLEFIVGGTTAINFITWGSSSGVTYPDNVLNNTTLLDISYTGTAGAFLNCGNQYITNSSGVNVEDRCEDVAVVGLRYDKTDPNTCGTSCTTKAIGTGGIYGGILRDIEIDGNRMTQQEFALRLNGMQRVLVSDNYFHDVGADASSPPGQRKGAVAFRTNNARESSYNVVQHNLIGSGVVAGIWQFQVAGSLSGVIGGAQEHQNSIYDCNVQYLDGIFGSELQWEIMAIQGGDITLRNNIIDLTSLAEQSLGVNPAALSVKTLESGTTNGANIDHFNTTVYWPTASTKGLTGCTGTRSGHECRGLLLHENASGSITAHSGSGTASDNVTTTPAASPFAATPDPLDIASYLTTTAGGANDTGYDFGSPDDAWMRHDCRNGERQAGAYDAGAFEADSSAWQWVMP